MKKFLESIFGASTRPLRRPLMGKNRSQIKGRRLQLESLENREVFNTDLLSSISIGNETSNSIVNQVASDVAGNTYLRGSFGGTVDFDPAAVHADGMDVLTAQSTADGFIAKYAADNSLLWVRNINAAELKLDTAGNIYLAGSFIDSLQLGSANLVSAGASDGFVAKLDGSGSTLWATRWGGTGNEFGHEIDLDANGNIFTGGLRTDPTTNARLGIDVAKLSSSGTTLWTKYVATYSQGIPGKGSFDLTADSSGGVVLVGEFTGTVDFDPSSRKYSASTGSYSQWASYVLNLNSSGNFKWVNTFVGTAGAGENDASAVDVDASGNIIVGGRFAGSVDFKSGTGTSILTEGGAGASYVTKLNGNGGFVWAKAFGGGSTTADYSFLYSLTVDPLGSIYIAGRFKGTVDFDPTSNVQNRTATIGGNDMYVVSLSSSGALSWFETIGGGNLLPTSIEVGTDGSIYVSGRFNGSIDFDPGMNEHTLSTNGSLNKGFVVRWRRS